MKKTLYEYENYILDLDGTLYFQPPVRRKMAFKLLFYYGLRPWKISQLFAIKKYRKRREKGDFAGDMFNATIEKWMVDKPLGAIKKHADKTLIEFIKQQHKAGKKIIIYSDYRTGEKLGALGISDFINYQYYAELPEINVLKPDAKGLENIVKILELDISETLFIGDRYEKDGKCAEAVSMDFLILSSKPSSRKKAWQDLNKTWCNPVESN